MYRNSIEEKATQILVDQDCYSSPVPVKKLIRKLDIELKPENFGEEISGLLVVEDGRNIIGYNSLESNVRQRFTLAHELGHYFLHLNSKKEKLFVDRVLFRKNNSNLSSKEKTREIEANNFAAAILMPRELVIEEFQKISKSLDLLTDEDIVEKLAKKFKVSSLAMTYRLINLELYSD